MDRPARRAIREAQATKRAADEAARLADQAAARAFTLRHREARRVSRRAGDAYRFKPSLWPINGDPLGRIPDGMERFLTGRRK